MEGKEKQTGDWAWTGKNNKTKNRSSRVVVENWCVRGKVKLPAFYSPRKVCVFTDTV